MLRWQPEWLSIGVGPQAVAWAPPGGAQLHARAVDLAPATAALQDGRRDRMDAMRGALRQLTEAGGGAADKAPPRVLLADSLARYWLQAVPENVRSLPELQAVAQARCTQLFGGTAAQWQVSGDWQARGQFVCAALPAWIVEAVRQEMPRTRHVSTPFAQCLRAPWIAALPDGWSCLALPGMGVVLAVAHGRVASLRTMPVDSAADGPDILDALAVELHREAVRSLRPIDGPVTWLVLGPDPGDLPQAGGMAFRRVSWPGNTTAWPAHVARDDASQAAWLGCSSHMWEDA